MTRKNRFFALTALVLALAVGSTAVRGWSRAAADDPNDNSPSCPATGQCSGLIRKAPHINRGCSAAHKKVLIKKVKTIQQDSTEECCCKGKPKANCLCKDKSADASCSSTPCCPPVCGMPGCAVPPHCGPVCVPFPGIAIPTPPGMPCCPDVVMPVPPPQMHVFASVGECKQYTVAMKLVESRKDEGEKTVASPTLCVCAGHSAQVSAGLSHADLCKADVPLNDMGHEGHHITVTVVPTHDGRVCLTCKVWTVERDQNCDGTPCLAESQVSTTQCVKLGKSATLHCNRSCGHHSVDCRLEVTVSEQCNEETKSVVRPAGPVQVGNVFANFQGCHMLEGPVQATWSAPVPREIGGKPSNVKPFAARTFTIREVPHPECGKCADAEGPRWVLEIASQSTTMSCEKLTLTQDGCEEVVVSVRDGKVCVSDGTFEATADSVTHEVPGLLVLEGHVKVSKSQGEVEVESGKVRLPLSSAKTGVISSPSLVQ